MQNNVCNSNLTLCPNCFAHLDAHGKCSVCGYDATQTVRDYGKLAPGTVLKDRYYIGRPLGQGGFGITYLSYDLMLDVKLAIKEYYPSGIATRLEGSKTVTNSNPENETDFREGLGKFLAEARTLAKFSEYANIVSVRDYFEYNGTAYMVMGYLEGQTLLEYLKQHGNKLPFAETYKILAPVMDALNAAHASGLIHRDISPDNIFITHDGTVKLLDFGAAKSAMALANQQSHSIVLKKGYSPSEQYRENGRLGPWTDIYSMGATFYRCLVGEVPQDSIDRLFEDEVVKKLKGNANSAPTQATAAILKAMSISEADRFQNMSDFKTAMNGQERTSNAVKTAKKVPEQPKAVASKNEVSEKVEQPAKTKQKRKIMIIAAVLCLAIAAVVVYPKAKAYYANKMYEKGKTYYDIGNDTAALSYFHKAADKGNPDAMRHLGDMYLYHIGVCKSETEADKWYQKAFAEYKKLAEAGNSVAMYGLARMYEGDDLIFGNWPQWMNQEESIKWYQKAADNGNADAMLKLGEHYRREKYRIVRSRFGRRHHRRICVGKENTALSNKWYQQAIGHYKKLAEAGDAAAMFKLGECYYHEGWQSSNMFDCTIKDEDDMFKEALLWYKKSAGAGNSVAMCRLAEMHDPVNLGAHGDAPYPIEVSFEEKTKWYQKAAEAGNIDAMCRLGDDYEQSYEKRYMWNKKAAEAGNPRGLFQLGEMYERGKYVGKNLTEAIRCYKKAVEAGDGYYSDRAERQLKELGQ